MAKKGGGTVEWKSMTLKGQRKPDALQARDVKTTKWWSAAEEDVAGAIYYVLKHIKDTQTGLVMQRQVCARLYGGSVPGSAYGPTIDRMQLVHPSLTGRLTYNLVAIVIDTLVSKITKNQVRPLFITQGGNYRTQRRAKKLSQFAEGIFYETKFDELAPFAFRDGTVLGDGIIHCYLDRTTGRVALERVIPDELYVDTVDGLYRAPQQMYRAKVIERQRLIELFGYKDNGHKDQEKIDTINRCPPAGKEHLGASYQYVSDGVAVVEGWKLPTGPDTGDGAHVIAIETGVLERGKWERLRFPFARFSWKPRMYGWHGGGLAEELIGTQVEMNHLLHMMQRAFRLMSGFKIVVENGTVPDAHFNDRLGTILHVPKGALMPQYIAPPALNPQYFEHFERIKARGFEIARLSQLSATGVKPAGLDSGEAQRVYHDIESEGFQTVGKAYEQFHLDVIQLALDEIRELAKEGKKYPLKAPVSSYGAPGVKFLRSIEWDNVKMDEDGYVLQCYPVSSLPSTPAGRIATVTELARAGYVDEATARKLMNFPDLAQVQTLLGSAEDWVMKQLDKIIEDGEFEPPDGLMNLQLAETLVVQEIALGEANDMEPEKLDMLRDWLMQVKYLQGLSATAAPQAAQPSDVASSAGLGVIPSMGGPEMTGGAMQGPQPQEQLMAPAGPPATA